MRQRHGFDYKHRTIDSFPRAITNKEVLIKQRNAYKTSSDEGIVNPSVSNVESYGAVDSSVFLCDFDSKYNSEHAQTRINHSQIQLKPKMD